jgi:uncharacterized membrane protein (DUF4010 family)
MVVSFQVLLLKSLVALGLGGLIGIDRERRHKGYPAGIRTLAFLSLIGMLTSFIAEASLNNWVIPLSIVTIILLVAVAYGASKMKSGRSWGLTTTIVLLLTFFIGLISYFDDYQYIAIALAIITTLILTERDILHDFARGMKKEELLDALKFGIVAFVILPLLPNQTIDPFNVLNPYNLWLMAVLIIAISFAGYIAAKFVGPSRGVYWSGALGGIVSSTAVSSSLSIVSKRNKDLTNACAVGITLASSLMFIRVLFEAYLINPALGYHLIIPLVLPTLIGGVLAYYYWKNKKSTTRTELVEKSPFNFIPALKFTLLLAVILLGSKIASDFVGDAGTYVTSVLAGLVDTDAITLSMATLAGDSITFETGRNAVLIACLTNTLVKLFISWSVGSKNLFKKMAFNYALMITPLLTIIFLTF